MKNFIVYNSNTCAVSSSYNTKEEAEAEAKRKTAKFNVEFGIYMLVAKTMNPVPDIQIVEVKV